LSKIISKNLKHCQETLLGTCKWRSTDPKSGRRQWQIKRYGKKAKNQEINKSEIRKKALGKLKRYEKSQKLKISRSVIDLIIQEAEERS